MHYDVGRPNDAIFIVIAAALSVLPWALTTVPKLIVPFPYFTTILPPAQNLI